MSGTAMSGLAVAVLVAVAVALEVSARRRPDGATAGQALAAAMRSTPGRAAVLLTWAWLGVHFLAR